MLILIAETDVEPLKKMARALEQAGHRVTAATDGLQAWSALVGAVPPDLLVTRICLGNGKPPGTALGLRAYAHDPPIPVIYIPANPELAQHADPAHGAVLTRPFTVSDLLRTVERVRQPV